jgi:predicted transcriptional regulator
MSSAVILSIKPEYARQILAGTKTIELRRSPMGLEPRDVVLVYISAPDQCLGFWFRISKIETLPVEEMWRRHQDRLGIERDPYANYFEGSPTATGLHVVDVHPLKPEIPLAEVRKLVPDFVPPQGLIRLRDLTGRFEEVLSRLSLPLPPDAFPQQSLFAGLSVARASRA